jgi:hypothetical protein
MHALRTFVTRRHLPHVFLHFRTLSLDDLLILLRIALLTLQATARKATSRPSFNCAAAMRRARCGTFGTTRGRTTVSPARPRPSSRCSRLHATSATTRTSRGWYVRIVSTFLVGFFFSFFFPFFFFFSCFVAFCESHGWFCVAYGEFFVCDVF